MYTFLKKHAGKVMIFGLTATSIIAIGVFAVPLSSLVFTGFAIAGVAPIVAGGVLYWTKVHEQHNSVEAEAESDELVQNNDLELARKKTTQKSSKSTSPLSADENKEVMKRLIRLESTVRELADKNIILEDKLRDSESKQNINELANKRTIDEMQKNNNARLNSLESGLSSSSRDAFFNLANNMISDDNFDQDKDQKQTKKP